MTLEELIIYKNFVYGEYEVAKAKNSHHKMRSHAFHVASLEESIADELIKQGRSEDAVINLISQGSMLIELGRNTEGKSAYERARGLTTKETVKKWIDEGLQKL